MTCRTLYTDFLCHPHPAELPSERSARIYLAWVATITPTEFTAHFTSLGLPNLATAVQEERQRLVDAGSFNITAGTMPPD